MSAITTSQPANHKNKEMLYQDTANLKTLVFYASEEINFLQKLLSAEVFERNIPNLYEKLKEYKQQLEKMAADVQKWNTALDNHKNQIRGLLECDDVECDNFYDGQHKHIKTTVLNFVSDFNLLKLEVFRYSSTLFSKPKKQKTLKP